MDNVCAFCGSKAHYRVYTQAEELWLRHRIRTPSLTVCDQHIDQAARQLKTELAPHRVRIFFHPIAEPSLENRTQ